MFISEIATSTVVFNFVLRVFSYCNKSRYFPHNKKHLHDRAISLGGEVWTNKTSLMLPLFIEEPDTQMHKKR
jgi:hypothetical protein